MHDLGLCEGILEAVLARAGDREVSEVRVRAGIRHGTDREHLRHSFHLVADNTAAANAWLELVTVPAQLSCRSCGRTASTVDILAVCPYCDSDDVDVTGGDELILESIRYASPATT